MRFQLRALSIALISVHAMSWMHDAGAQSSPRADDEPAVLPPVVVTASKRGETLERLNGSASVADRTSLDDAQVTSTLELDRVFPELYTSYSATFLFPIITLRGVTSAQDFYNPALTVYVDGVPQLPTFAAQSLLGVEQVELLKGPQGTLYGKSAQGGVLNIVTHKPDNTPQFAARAGVSSRDGYQLQAEGSGPLVKDLLYGSVSLLGNDVNGDIRSDVIGSDRLGGVRSRAGNVKLRLAPMGSPWEMGLSAGRDCAKGDQEVYTLFDDYKSRKAYVSPNLPEAYRDFYQKRCANSFALNGQYDFGLWRLNVIASSQRVHTARHWPLDAYFPQFGEHWKQNTQEVRLSTRPSEAGEASSRAWDAVFGLYRQEVDMSRSYQFDMVLPSLYRVTDSSSSNRSESLAAYGDVTWHLTPKADLTAGLRFSRDEARTHFQGNMMGSAFQGRASANQTTWLGHLAAGYQFAPSWRGYVNVAQGYKPLGYNLAPSSVDDAEGYGRERSISYEAGLRYSGRDLRASLALYRVDSKDVQLYGDGDMGNQTLRNVGDTRSVGMEFNTEWDVTRQWTLSAGGFINDATFRRFEDSSACTGCNHNDVPMAPRYGLTLAAKGNVRVADTVLRPQLSVRRVGSHYFDSANTLRQGAYTLVDAGLGWNPTSNLELMLYVQNLTDEDYRTYGFSYGATGNFAQVAPGRTVGLTATYLY
ncbi:MULTISPECIES: TonB-dependent receptor [Pseudomonadota]|uniref:TonB-dependent receptor n=1 Tax=Alcaligenes xylosoxydans xylosoxydans TaxID=85698 RepID=UPI00040719DA|nr:TonB-dependent receptor [Achromobacter xylosoxidans]CKG97443.1 Colicin I receptor precursor [Achromobacter xylosoxidans]HBO0525588.1 TonB-dependent receptor [Pseudomonas aeruginosa]HEP9474079.1 TonB-dependent receptor [Pseudomonas aeruginosa]